MEKVQRKLQKIVKGQMLNQINKKQMQVFQFLQFCGQRILTESVLKLQIQSFNIFKYNILQKRANFLMKNQSGQAQEKHVNNQTVNKQQKLNKNDKNQAKCQQNAKEEKSNKMLKQNKEQNSQKQNSLMQNNIIQQSNIKNNQNKNKKENINQNKNIKQKQHEKIIQKQHEKQKQKINENKKENVNFKQKIENQSDQKYKTLITQQLQKKYEKLINRQTMENTKSYDLSALQTYVSNIYQGIIKQKLTLVNQNLITMKNCKIQIAQSFLIVQLTISSWVQDNLRTLKEKQEFFKENDDFLTSLMAYLKSIYPRGIPLDAAELSNKFKQFDVSGKFKYDILKNANIHFLSQDPYDITKNIKLLFNKILDQLNQNYSKFYSLIKKIDKKFKIDNIKAKVKQSQKQISEIEEEKLFDLLSKIQSKLSQQIQTDNQKIKLQQFYDQIKQKIDLLQTVKSVTYPSQCKNNFKKVNQWQDSLKKTIQQKKQFKIDNITHKFKLSQTKISEIERKNILDSLPKIQSKWSQQICDDNQKVKQKIDLLQTVTNAIQCRNNLQKVNQSEDSLKKDIQQKEGYFSKYLTLNKDFKKKLIQMNQKYEMDFLIGRKISENTAKYLILDTGKVQVHSPQIARVLIKWLQDLEKLINFPDKGFSQQFEPKFYQDQQEIIYQNILNLVKPSQTKKYKQQKLRQSIISKIKQFNQEKDKPKGQFLKLSLKITKKQQFRRFNIELTSILSKVQLQIKGFQKKAMEIIKFSSFNSKFISWIVQNNLIKAIQNLIRIGQKYSKDQYKILNLVRFKVTDLMRCQIFGNRKKLSIVLNKFREMQRQNEIQMIKINNRFKTPMGDAVILFKLPFSFIICECQLILSEQKNGEDYQKLKYIQQLNHFLYELQRSPFGVLGQISMFLQSNCESVKTYCSQIKININKIRQNQIKECMNKCNNKLSIQKKGDQVQNQNNNSEQQQEQYEQLNEFICNNCLKYQQKYSNLSKYYKCSECSLRFCNHCCISLCKKYHKIEGQQCNKCRVKQFKISWDMIRKLFKNKIQKVLKRVSQSSLNCGLSKQTIAQSQQGITLSKISSESLYRSTTKTASKNNIKVTTKDFVKYVKISQQLINYNIDQQFKKRFIQISKIQGIQIKQNQIKVQKLISYLKKKFDKKPKRNKNVNKVFMLLKFKNKIIFKMYKYNSAQSTIQNYNQNQQKYQKHQNMQIHSYDWIFFPTSSCSQYEQHDNQNRQYFLNTGFLFQDQKYESLINKNKSLKFKNSLQLIKHNFIFKSHQNIQKRQQKVQYQVQLAFILNINQVQSEDFNKKQENIQSNQNSNPIKYFVQNNVDFATKVEDIYFQKKQIQDQMIKNLLDLLDQTKLIKNLYLSDNIITDISIVLKAFPNVQFLDLRANKIKQVPLICNKFIQSLLLAGNPLAKIDDFLKGYYQNLKQIDFILQFNTISKLNTPKLKKLSLQTTITQKICQQFLYTTYYNNLTELRLKLRNYEQINHYPKLLTILKIYGCNINNKNIEQFYKKIEPMTLINIKFLELINCDLTQIPSIKIFINLRHFDLRLNNILCQNIKIFLINHNNNSIIEYPQLKRLLLSINSQQIEEIQSYQKKLKQQKILNQQCIEIKRSILQQSPNDQLTSKGKTIQYKKLQRLQYPKKMQIQIYYYIKFERQQDKSIKEARKMLLPPWNFINSCPIQQFKQSKSSKGLIKYLHKNENNNLKYIKINIQYFLQHQWKILKSLHFQLTEIGDDGWKHFCKNGWNFVNLKKLGFVRTQIKKICQQDLNLFQNLIQLDVRDNELTDQSQNSLIEIMKKRSSLKIKFHYSEAIYEKYKDILKIFGNTIQGIQN